MSLTRLEQLAHSRRITAAKADLPHDTGYAYPIRILAFLSAVLHFDTDFS